MCIVIVKYVYQNDDPKMVRCLSVVIAAIYEHVQEYWPLS